MKHLGLLIVAASFSISNVLLTHGAALPEFIWDSTGCSHDVDFCGTLEFCKGNDIGSYGYRMVGEGNCDMMTAPIVRMKAGKTYQMTLYNSADVPTNIHTHGLHISGDGNADDITKVVDPEYCMKYTYAIPSDHMGGTNWYHPHKYQLTSAQVAGGAFGMLIIEENISFFVPDDDDGIIEFISNERQLVLSKLGGSGYYANGIAPSAVGGKEQIDIVTNDWVRLRILSVDSSGGPNTVTIASGSTCNIRQVARDGSWRNSVPKATVQTNFTLTGSSRIDLAINCPDAGSYDITYGSMSLATLVAVEDQSSVTAGIITVPCGESILVPYASNLFDRSYERNVGKSICGSNGF